MNLSFLERRLKGLEDNIEQSYELLKEFEDALRCTNNPRDKFAYKREIEEIRKSANRYQQEYKELAEQLKSEPTVEQKFSGQLSEIAGMLEMLLGGQHDSHNNQRAIRSDLVEMRQTLLNHYDVGERAIVSSITEKLNENQITLTQILLDGIDANHLSESEMQDILEVLKERFSSLSNKETDTVFGVLDSPEVSIKHRLKVAIPLIPQLLPFLPSVDYEGELELGTGFGAKEAWESLKNGLRGK